MEKRRRTKGRNWYVNRLAIERSIGCNICMKKIFNSNENNNERKIYVNSTVENVNYLNYYIQFNYI